MTTMPAEANFSELIQKPKDTVARMQINARRGLLLHRRDEEDLYLTTAARAEQAVQVVDSTTRMFVALLRESPAAVELLTRAFPEAFPWVRFLPRKAVQEFLLEFVETARASTSLGSLAPITTVIAAWKHTAEIYADPELHATLTQDHGDGDFGDVPVPPSGDE
ncbi:hypothetical protein ACWEKU_24760 [Streptomyces californicus]